MTIGEAVEVLKKRLDDYERENGARATLDLMGSLLAKAEAGIGFDDFLSWLDPKYIRKDALLELIKEESKFWDDGEMIFRELIDKIKSM